MTINLNWLKNILLAAVVCAAFFCSAQAKEKKSKYEGPGSRRLPEYMFQLKKNDGSGYVFDKKGQPVVYGAKQAAKPKKEKDLPSGLESSGKKAEKPVKKFRLPETSPYVFKVTKPGENDYIFDEDGTAVADLKAAKAAKKKKSKTTKKPAPPAKPKADAPAPEEAVAENAPEEPKQDAPEQPEKEYSDQKPLGAAE